MEPNQTTNQNENVKLHDGLVIILLVAVLLIGLLIAFINNKNNHIRIDELKHPIATTINPFDSIRLSAKAAIVWDMKNKKIIYSHNESEALPLASLTKVMTALTAIELIPDYTTVTISKAFLEEEGDIGLLRDEKWKLKDLFSISLVSSSNDGVRAIASVAGSVIGAEKLEPMPTDAVMRARFIHEMNKKATLIGLKKTHFENENGLDKDSTISGAYGSVEDVALLFDYVLRNHNSLLESTRYPRLTLNSLDNISHNLHNTNTVVNMIPGLLGSKTGFTDLAGGNLAIITDLGLEGPYIISVLGSTEEGRFTDIETLVGATTEYVKNIK